ncbi:MAG: hypothetical protein COA39_004415 [Sulfurimonas sp.]|nr:hypothetical protein [Sulfurimonas sp.]
MEKIKQIFIRTMLLFSLLSSSLLAVGNRINYLNPFESAFNTADNIIYGDYASIASSVECVDDGNAACNNDYDGYLFDATTIYKNSVSTTTIPLNSSTETLILPNDIDGQDILYAGLYWQGNITGDDEANYNQTFSNSNKKGGIIGRNNVSMIDASGTQHLLTADKVWYHDFWGNGTGFDGGHRSFYQAYEDVTSILQNSYTRGDTNSYTVGNIKASAGEDYPTYFWADDLSSFDNVRIGFWGNWQLIVIYSHSNIAAVTPKPKPKNIAIFHGFQPLIPLIPNSTKSIDINITGFLTPKQAPVNAKMLFYGSGGEKKLQYDLLEIQDKKTTNFTTISNATNPLTGAFNGSISSFGVPIDSTISYYPGTDSDEFNVSNAMDTTQSTTILRLSAKNIGGTGDQFFPGLIAFSTDVYEPSFCYDYAYKQLNKFFTEDNNGSQNPRIVGYVTPEEPITVSIYLKNLVDSDVLVKDVNLTIQDINTTQAKYVRDSTYLALNSSFKSTIDDSDIALNGGSVSDGSINGIPIGDLNTNDYFYTYYDIITTAGTQDVNMTLNVNASYTLQTSTASIPYTLKLGSELKMCSTSNYQYSAQKGAFNVVHNNYYNANEKYYNLPTQITQRVGNFNVISIDENDILTSRSAIVAVEFIDAAAFHSAEVSCQELASSINEKVWIVFDDNTSNTFNKNAINQAIIAKRTLLNPASDFYKEARENAAFRISYPLDANGGLQTIEHPNSNNPDWKLIDFPSYGGASCSNNTGKVAQLCGNNGSGSGANGMNEEELTICMACIYGLNTKLTCSADNLSIRPEAFTFQFNDANQTLLPALKIIDNLSSTSKATDLAAGYIYNMEINATNYINTTGSNGYTKLYGTFNSEDFTQYIWSPSTALTTCNDESNTTLSYRIANGSINLDLPTFTQVGRYKFNIIDTSWTTVDNNPLYMKHHKQTDTNGINLFRLNIDGSITQDCVLNSSLTQTELYSSLNGCDISSEHDNADTGINVSDMFVTFHPYKFDLSNINSSIGLNQASLAANSFIYTSDLNVDENMSYHLNGSIIAQGENNQTLSNFVDGCYAKPLNITISKSNISLPTAYQYRLHIYDENTTEIGTSLKADLNNSIAPIPIAVTSFPKALNGSANTRLNLNYNRDVTQTINPEEITFISYDVNCTTLSGCTFNANLVNNKTTQGSKDLNSSIALKHYYGRSHASKQRYQITTDAEQKNANIYYEVFCYATDSGGVDCNKTLLPSTKRTDDIRWYVNPFHNVSNDGNVSSVIQKGETGTATDIVDASSLVNANPTTLNLSYDASEGYTYRTTMEINSSSWLIYNQDDSNATKNQFSVEFNKLNSDWSGRKETTTTTKHPGTAIINRRSMW